MSDRTVTVEEYIARYPDDIQEILRRVRQVILDAVPSDEEKVRYDIPAVMLGGRYALHYAAWKRHLGIYPVAAAEPELEEAIAPYRSGKDSLTFPYSKPIPYELIGRVAAFVAERSAR
ncbi:MULTISPECIES: iron chaperone [unclassified Leifsonia]|uniref:iron chaperone n=1 Tax=unclassified Leifsonia TaxID=2663824 RepID=UPI0006FB63BD|nr:MULTISPECIES: DUF1801 domain-containing protein [unclassified Leifsonia]KQX05829.1 hypothetical protein ASC59_14640 [Leifsonia sp. Root1293]KRA09463.1 hypothetical protein ASD61_14635 [Leifsonia sp. Root60]